MRGQPLPSHPAHADGDALGFGHASTLESQIGEVAREIEELLAAPSARARRDVVRRQGGKVRSVVGYLLMTVLLAQLRQNADHRSARALEQCRRSLGSPRAIGIPASWTRRRPMWGRLDGFGMSPWIDAFAQHLIAWVDMPTYREERRFLEAHAKLLDPLSDVLLRILARTRSDEPEQERVVRRCQRMLHDIRAQGSSTAAIRAAYVNVDGGLALDLPPWLDDLTRPLRSAVAPDMGSQSEPPNWPSVLGAARTRAGTEDDVGPEIVAELNLMLWDALDAQAARDLSTAAPSQEEGIECLRQALQTYTFERYPGQYARVYHQLGTAYRARRLGTRRSNQEEALRCFREALRVYTLDRYPDEFASAQVNLGNTYQERLEGLRRDNQEQAVACYQATLDVYTLDAFPRDYALVQHNLGTLYQDRIAGSPAENSERSIACFREVLRISAVDQFPEDHANALVGLGNAFLERTTGTRRENIEQAIACFTEALQVYTLAAHPTDYARTQHNLGNAYMRRLAGAQQENREVALACYQEALQVYSPTTHPDDYARTLVGLADAYDGRLEGGRSENIERALQYYRQALDIYTMDDDPQAYGLVQNNLGITYMHRHAGNRNDNIEEAISCFQEALRVYRQDTQPRDYALAQLNLGGAWAVRLQGDRNVNCESAIHAYQAALGVYTFDEFPADYAQAYFGLGSVYAERATKEGRLSTERAMWCYEEALRVYTPDAFPVDYRDTQLNIAWLAIDHMVEDAHERGDRAGIEAAYARAHTAYAAAREMQAELGWVESTERGRIGLRGQYRATRDMYVRDAWCLLQLGRLREAVVALEAGRAQALAESQALAGVALGGICQRHADEFVRARQQLQQARMSDERPALRAARDALLAMRQEIRNHCQPDFLASEPTFEDVAHAPALDQVVIYVAAADRGGAALVVYPADGKPERGAPEPAHIPLPLLTAAMVDDWMAHADDEGWVVGGMRLALEHRIADLLRHWVLRARDVEEQQHRWARPLGDLAATLPPSMATAREALERLTAAWARQAERLLRGDAAARIRAAEIQARSTMSLRAALAAGIIARELGWYFQQVELEHLLPQLSKVVMGPLRAGLDALGLDAPEQQVALIACGRLGALPLHAALVPASETGDLVPFQDTCELTYQASARSLAAARAARSHLPEEGPFLTIGDPQPTSAAQLPFARRSAQRVLERARQSGRVASAALVGHEATRERVLSELSHMRRQHPGVWVEIAGHGHADAFDPRKCYMLLARDATLTLANLQRERLLEGVRCLTASGCVTALGDLELAPDELSSFAAGVLQAGAAAAVATLWSVSDRATALLMERFVEMVLANPHVGPSRALRDAASWLRSLPSIPWRREERDAPDHAAGQPGAGDAREAVDEGDDHERGLADNTRADGEERLDIEADQESLRLAAPAAVRIVGPAPQANQAPYAHPIYWASMVVYGA